MNWKTNVYGVQSFKNAIDKWLEGGSMVKGKGVPWHPSVFDIDGHHPLYIDRKLKGRK